MQFLPARYAIFEEETMSQPITSGEYLARVLRTHGVTHLFQQEVSLRVTTRAGEMMGIQDVLTHSEAAAAYMADGYARAKGSFGVCSAQSVGAANLAAGLGDAFFAGTPVLAITGKKTWEFMERNAYQELNHARMFEAVTKFHGEVAAPGQLSHLLRLGIREAMTGKPGPVHLDFQGHTGEITEIAPTEAEVFMEPDLAVLPPFRPAADAAGIARAMEALAAASRPVLVAGRGALVSGAGPELDALANRLDAPVATTPDGKTVIDESDPKWCGIVGAYGMHAANRTVAEADLVIFVGTQASDQTTLNWTTPTPGTPIIQIDLAPFELGRNYPGAVKLWGDAKTVLAQLLAAVPAAARSEWRKAAATYVADTLAAQQAKMQIPGRPIAPERLCLELSRAMPDNALLVSDTGYSAIWTSTMVRMKATQKFIRAAGTLGWGFPASLGAKCGAPERPVFCFTGDGGFYYHLPEMETAVRHGIKTITVLNNNGMLMQDAPTMHYTYPQDPAQGIKKITFTPVDFSKIAAEFGMASIRVTDPEDLAPAFAKALALSADRPVLIEVVTDPTGTGPLSPTGETGPIGEK